MNTALYSTTKNMASQAHGKDGKPSASIYLDRSRLNKGENYGFFDLPLTTKGVYNNIGEKQFRLIDEITVVTKRRMTSDKSWVTNNKTYLKL